MHRTWRIAINFIIIISLHFSEVTSQVCFGCRDSSNLKGKDDCQVNTLIMEDLHTKLVYDYGNNATNFLRDYSSNPYVQDCSVYANHTFCCVEEFEGGGSIKSYIRSCCDGKTWSFDPVKVPKLIHVTRNNNSLCQHDTTSVTTICVQMCAGNFCNGPVAKATSTYSSPFVQIVLFYFIWIYWLL